METNTKPRYICRFKDKNDCISYEWKDVNMETNMKIDVEESIIYSYDRLSDLVMCVEMLGENGYFSDDKNFQSYDYGTLSEVRVRHKVKEGNYLFVSGNDETDISCYKYFIPENKVVFAEEPAKKYRPFKTVGEFLTHVGLKDESEKVQFLEFRSTASGDVYNMAYNGYEIDKFGSVYVHLGSHMFSLQELYQYHEYALNSFEWLPFGVEE